MEAGEREDQVTPESLESHKSEVAPETTSWYWPLAEVPNFRTLVMPVFAVIQEEAE